MMVMMMLVAINCLFSTPNCNLSVLFLTHDR